MKIAFRALIVLSLFLAACTSREITANDSPESIYRKAAESVKDKQYESAQKFIDHIRQEFPFSPFAVEVELLEADMSFKKEEWQAAIKAYENFEALHPFHEKTPYALYRRGLSNYKLMDTADRDVGYAREAMNVLGRYIRQNPQSDKVEDAKVKYFEAMNLLADHEIYVARFYIRKDKDQAALVRLRGLLKDYPDSKVRDEALKLALELEAKIARDQPAKDDKKGS